MLMEITPEDAMLALYPPQAEPDWETLDLDDDRWHTWFTPPVWHGPASRCSVWISGGAYAPGTEPNNRQCSRRAISDLDGKPVCHQHHPVYEQRRKLNRLWSDRFLASKKL